MAQEALSNARKHAGATRVWVSLAGDERALLVRVSDDGRGFAPSEAAPGSVGLHSMAERARLLGGALDIHSAPGEGTRVTASFPAVSLGRARKRSA